MAKPTDKPPDPTSVYQLTLRLYFRKPTSLDLQRRIIENLISDPDSDLHKALSAAVPTWRGKSYYSAVGKAGDNLTSWINRGDVV